MGWEQVSVPSEVKQRLNSYRTDDESYGDAIDRALTEAQE